MTASGDPARPSPDDPAGRARALQYDLVLNGWELGGGSVRIHRRDLLERSFPLQGHTLEGMREKFGAVLDAFEYGAPPHGGIALGIDRWAALFANQTNIREVMAFPKTQSGSDLMLEAPSPPEPEQFEELGLRFVGVPRESRRRRVSAREPAPRSRRDRDSGAPGRSTRSRRRPRLAAARCGRAVHRVLGDLLPLGRGHALDRARCSAASSACRSSRWSAWPSTRRYGPLPLARSGSRLIAGVFFAGDLLTFWHHAIDIRRGGARDGARQPPGPRRRRWSRGCSSGSGRRRNVVIAAADRARRGRADLRASSAPMRTARTRRWASRSASSPRCRYAGYLLIIRRGGRDPRARRTGRDRHGRRRPLVAAIVGRWSATSTRSRRWPSLAWLACSASRRQSLGYLLISISLPRLPAVADLADPARPAGHHGDVRGLLLGEPPSIAQLAGVALVVGGIALATGPIARLRDDLRGTFAPAG